MISSAGFRELTSPFRQRRCCVFKLHKNKLHSTNAATTRARSSLGSEQDPSWGQQLTQWEDIPPKITWPSPQQSWAAYLCAGVADNRQASRPWGFGKEQESWKKEEKKKKYHKWKRRTGRSRTASRDWPPHHRASVFTPVSALLLRLIHNWWHFFFFFCESMHDN